MAVVEVVEVPVPGVRQLTGQAVANREEMIRPICHNPPLQKGAFAFNCGLAERTVVLRLPVVFRVNQPPNGKRHPSGTEKLTGHFEGCHYCVTHTYV